MKLNVHIPKLNQNLPSHYQMTLHYHDGSHENFELVQHILNQESQFIDFLTKEEKWNWVPLASVRRIAFDKRFTQILEEKCKPTETKPSTCKP